MASHFLGIPSSQPGWTCANLLAVAISKVFHKPACINGGCLTLLWPNTSPEQPPLRPLFTYPQTDIGPHPKLPMTSLEA